MAYHNSQYYSFISVIIKVKPFSASDSYENIFETLLFTYTGIGCTYSSMIVYVANHIIFFITGMPNAQI